MLREMKTSASGRTSRDIYSNKLKRKNIPSVIRKRPRRLQTSAEATKDSANNVRASLGEEKAEINSVETQQIRRKEANPLTLVRI